MDKIHSISVEKALEALSNTLITPRFLELVEKWSKFDCKKPLESGDITVTNMGTFEKRVKVADIDFSKNIMKQVGDMLGGVSKGKTKEKVETYDVTKIVNDSVCTKYNTILLISERKEGSSLEFKAMFPSKLYIYAICPDEEDGNETPKDDFPSFEVLKKNFESNKSQYRYYSLISEKSFGGYTLMPYNDKTDRIKDFYSIHSDIRCLESDEYILKATKHIKVPKRFTEEGLDKYKEEQHKKLVARIKKK